MRSNHTLVGMETTFTEDNLVPNAGLVVPASLAQRLGVGELIDQRVQLPEDAAGGAASGAKAMTVIGAMLAGGDCIDDVDVLRAGAAKELFDDTRAPSTVGTWLRGCDWGTVRQLDAASRGLLARAWDAGLGPDLDGDVTLDLDSTICRVFGTAKQGVGFGYTGVRGLHPLLATTLARKSHPDPETVANGGIWPKHAILAIWRPIFVLGTSGTIRPWAAPSGTYCPDVV